MKLVLLVGLCVPSVLLPVMHHLWLTAGSGNANYVYFQVRQRRCWEFNGVYTIVFFLPMDDFTDSDTHVPACLRTCPPVHMPRNQTLVFDVFVSLTILEVVAAGVKAQKLERQAASAVEGEGKQALSSSTSH